METKNRQSGGFLVECRNMENNIKTWIIVFVIFLIASCISFFVMIRGHSDKNPGAAQKALEAQKAAEEQIKNQEETADWKTYRNEEYGFEIKYPKDWLIDEGCQEKGTLDSDSIRTCFRYSIGDFEPIDEVVLLILKKKYSSIDDYINTQLEDANNKLGEGKVSFSKKQIDKGYKVTAKFPNISGSTYSLTDVILIRQDQIFILRQVIPEECWLAQCEVLNQMLSTFKFTK